MEDVDLSGQNKLCINKNLCSQYKIRWSKNKNLHNPGKNNSFFISREKIKIKVSLNSPLLFITNVGDFRK